MRKILVGAVSFFVLGLATACTPAANTNTAQTQNLNAAGNANVVTNEPTGTIVVEAGDGALSGVEKSSTDYIGTSARGEEAYLGSKGATATYTVTAPARGTYQLSVKLSDDGTWKSGYRDASVTVNGAVVLQYLHTSEDTRGWKWYTLGNVSLKEGANTVAFTKTNDMPAAYVMDEFKFVPVILQ